MAAFEYSFSHLSRRTAVTLEPPSQIRHHRFSDRVLVRLGRVAGGVVLRVAVVLASGVAADILLLVVAVGRVVVHEQLGEADDVLAVRVVGHMGQT